MLERTETQEVLENFATNVISQARRNMTLRSISTTKALYDSFEKNVEVFKNSISVDIESEQYNEYGKFVDRGVRGIVSGKSLDGWSFRSKGGKTGLKGMPPPDAFKKDKLLRPVSDSQAFATAVTVFREGIEPTEFFSKPFEAAFKALPDKIVEAYGLDLERFMEFTLKN